MKRQTFILFLMCLTTMPSWSTTRFVNKSATGSNNGSSWTNAWTELSSINWTGLSGGDTICIAGGTYTTTLTLGGNGTSASQLLVKRALTADATCGSSSSGWNNSFDAQVKLTGVINLGSASYVTLDGGVANGISVVMQNPTTEYDGIAVNGPTNGLVLRYIEVAGPCGTTICLQNGDHRSITLNHWNGSSYDLQSNMLMQYLNLHGACNLIWSAHSDQVIIEHSRFADSYTTDATNCHPNVIINQSSTNMTFRYNEVVHWGVEGILSCPNGGCSSSWAIYGNIWHDPDTHSYPRVLEVQGPGSTGPYLVYGNSFINIPFATMTTANSGSYSSDSQGRNNLFWNSARGVLPSNDYDLCNAGCGETHGQTYTTTDLFVNYAGQNYHLARSTAAGQSQPPPYNMDYDGNVRGADGIWDRGAYEFVSGARPNPPTNLTATPQ